MVKPPSRRRAQRRADPFEGRQRSTMFLRRFGKRWFSAGVVGATLGYRGAGAIDELHADPAVAPLAQVVQGPVVRRLGRTVCREAPFGHAVARNRANKCGRPSVSIRSRCDRTARHHAASAGSCPPEDLPKRRRTLPRFHLPPAGRHWRSPAAAPWQPPNRAVRYTSRLKPEMAARIPALDHRLRFFANGRARDVQFSQEEVK